MYKIYIYKFSLFKEKRTRLNKIQGGKKTWLSYRYKSASCCAVTRETRLHVFHDTSTNNCFFSLVTIYGLIPNSIMRTYHQIWLRRRSRIFFSLFLFRGRKLSRFGFGRWEISESSYRPSISLILFLNDNYAS